MLYARRETMRNQYDYSLVDILLSRVLTCVACRIVETDVKTFSLSEISSTSSMKPINISLCSHYLIQSVVKCLSQVGIPLDFLLRR